MTQAESRAAEQIAESPSVGRAVLCTPSARRPQVVVALPDTSAADTAAPTAKSARPRSRPPAINTRYFLPARV